MDTDIQTWGPATQLGESPVWDARAQVLYYCDIAAQRLHRLDPRSGAQQQWQFNSDLACCALTDDPNVLLLAMRDGLWRWDHRTGVRHAWAAPPYDPALVRFNDGKCDPQGRFWVGTLYEPRTPALAALYRFQAGQLACIAQDVTVSNGLAWSPDGTTMYWSDTTSHTIFAMDFDAATGTPSARRVWAQFPRREASAPLSAYGGRPDGAAVDQDGCYWVAMFEGARLLRLSPQGECLHVQPLPVQCPTMPCFGGADLRTLFVTTARKGREASELQAQPAAGHVLSLRVPVPGAPVPVFKTHTPHP